MEVATAPTASRKKASAPTAADPTELIRKEHTEAAVRTYGRGERIKTKSIKDKKLRANLRSLERKYQTAAERAKDAEILLEHESGYLEPEGPLERTYKVRQDEIVSNVGVETAKKGFELRLNDGLGPYVHRYSRNGRDLLLGGRKGHVACMEWREGKLGCELQLKETVRDVAWLHNNQTFAVAQKKYVYIYARDGVEIHRLPNHIEPLFLEFLPYHFLLASAGNSGYLKYTDTSTGQTVAELASHLGTPTALAQNPYNAILHLGHQKGLVTLWSPNSSTPLVKIQAHRGPVRAISMDRSGHYMVTAGQDKQMSVWDIRNFKPVHNYFLRQPASSLAVSDRDAVAVGWGTQVSVWRNLFDKSLADQQIDAQPKQQSPYMSWGGEGQHVERVSWCPFEDILGISHDTGFASAIVPGAGEPNFDALEVNPYETVKQRQETEVRQLLNKLRPEMISLDPNFIGNLDLASHEQRQREKDLDRDAKKAEREELEKLKNRGRGRNSALRRHLRKRGQKNIIDEKKVRMQEALKQQNSREEQKRRKMEQEYGPALARFARKG